MVLRTARAPGAPGHLACPAEVVREPLRRDARLGDRTEERCARGDSTRGRAARACARPVIAQQRRHGRDENCLGCRHRRRGSRRGADGPPILRPGGGRPTRRGASLPFSTHRLRRSGLRARRRGRLPLDGAKSSARLANQGLELRKGRQPDLMSGALEAQAESDDTAARPRVEPMPTIVTRNVSPWSRSHPLHAASRLARRSSRKIASCTSVIAALSAARPGAHPDRIDCVSELGEDPQRGGTISRQFVRAAVARPQQLRPATGALLIRRSGQSPDRGVQLAERHLRCLRRYGRNVRGL